MSDYNSAIESAEGEIAAKQSELNQLKSDLVQVEAAYAADWAHLEQLKLEISERQQIAQKPSGILNRFFQNSAVRDAKREISRLISEQQQLLAHMQKAPDIAANIRALESSIEERSAGIIRLKKKAAYSAGTTSQKKDRLLTLRAKVAAAELKSRKLGSSVRRKLPDQTHCPYCGEALGDRKHADHIYPLSKGGLSTPTNMVFACGPCNMKKRDMMLTAFIKANDLDRAEIEKRLEALGKEF